MKQISLSIAIFLLTLLSNNSQAQGASDVSFNFSPSVLKAAETYFEAINVTAVNIKAVRNFSKNHKEVSDAKWFSTDKGFTASFSTGGRNVKSVYDKKGNPQYEIISYTEQLLDAGIRHLVKSEYYDISIIGVHQFEFGNKTVYVVKMLDQNSAPVTLTVCDGQIKDITSLSKK